MSQIAAALRREDRDRMAAEARAFIAALEHDLIDAVDFDCRSPGYRRKADLVDTSRHLGTSRRPSRISR
jgi:hypothetical protein